SLSRIFLPLGRTVSCASHSISTVCPSTHRLRACQDWLETICPHCSNFFLMDSIPKRGDWPGSSDSTASAYRDSMRFSSLTEVAVTIERAIRLRSAMLGAPLGPTVTELDLDRAVLPTAFFTPLVRVCISSSSPAGSGSLSCKRRNQ